MTNYKSMFDSVFGETPKFPQLKRTIENDWLKVYYRVQDNSFSHEFGTERVFVAVPEIVQVYCKEIDSFVTVAEPYPEKIEVAVYKLLQGVEK